MQIIGKTVQKEMIDEPLLTLSPNRPTRTPDRTGQKYKEGDPSSGHALLTEVGSFSLYVHESMCSPIRVAGPSKLPPLVEYSLPETFLHN